MEHFQHLASLHGEALHTFLEHALTSPPQPPENAHALAAIKPSPGLREANLALTKLQIKASSTPDLLIVNASNCIEELDKVMNALAKRLREWYALSNPELERSNRDHRQFVDAVLANKHTATVMGAHISHTDEQAILDQAKMLHGMYAQRDILVAYLEVIMGERTPNLKKVAGATIGAKLLAMAGTLERLSRMPASTVQLLGAETALFRHLRNNRAKPPKHGIIFNHVLLQRAPRQARGKIARTLADKISIASKVDYFKGEYIGDTLYKQIEDRLREVS